MFWRARTLDKLNNYQKPVKLAIENQIPWDLDTIVLLQKLKNITPV